MSGTEGYGKIVAAMASLAPELPLSPELVLVSPPELATLARAQLPDLTVTPAVRAWPLGAVAFSGLCVLNSLLPFAVALATAD